MPQGLRKTNQRVLTLTHHMGEGEALIPLGSGDWFFPYPLPRYTIGNTDPAPKLAKHEQLLKMCSHR